MASETTKYYEKMTGTVPDTLWRTWNRDIQAAEQNRLKNPSVMDILGAQHQASNEQSDRNHIRAGASGSGSRQQWLHLALAIEEKQYVRWVISIFSYS